MRKMDAEDAHPAAEVVDYLDQGKNPDEAVRHTFGTVLKRAQDIRGNEEATREFCAAAWKGWEQRSRYCVAWRTDGRGEGSCRSWIQVTVTSRWGGQGRRVRPLRSLQLLQLLRSLRWG